MEEKHKESSVSIEKKHISSMVSSLLEKTANTALKRTVERIAKQADSSDSYCELQKLRHSLEQVSGSLDRLGPKFAKILLEEDYAALANEVTKGVPAGILQPLPEGHC